MLGLHRNICCDPSSEPSHRAGSDEGPQHIVSMRNKKNYPSIIIKYSLLPRALADSISSDELLHLDLDYLPSSL